MTDMQQWRRRIQPARSRTPYTPVEAEELDELCSPKRKLKPKLSSYFGHNPRSSLHEEHAPPITAELPSWPAEQLYPDPKAEDMVDSVLCMLMTDPYSPLEVQHNSSLMAILEDYLRMRDEKDSLQDQLESELASIQDLISKFHAAETEWIEERSDYKEEIKRLEVLLAKASQRGVAEVTLARQDSKLRNRKSHVGEPKEPMFEFLEKSKRSEDAACGGPRATVKAPILQSPSDKDKHMSLRLSQKKSPTDMCMTLPCGTPPLDTRFSLTNASALEQEAWRQGRRRAATSSTTTTTDDSFSTFSCEGDLLPDEAITAGPSRSHDVDDFSSIEQIANAVAWRRNVDPAIVLPQLWELFTAGADGGSRASSMPTNFGGASPRPTAPSKWPERSSSKHRTVISKASGFFQRLKPQLTVDTVAASFPAPSGRIPLEPGGDSKAHQDDLDGARRQPDLPQAVKDRILKKSASLAALNEHATKMAAADRAASSAMQRPLSPVAQSPPISAPGSASLPPNDGRAPSRIPTPVFNCMARRRQEREDSASSLLTAIKLSESSNRSNSMANSTYHSPAASQVDLAWSWQPSSACSASLAGLRTSSSKNLLEHSSTRRAGGNAAPASMTPSAAGDVNLELKFHASHTSARSHSQCSFRSDMIGPGQENIRPMG